MGAKSVGSAQYSEQDMDSLVKVDVIPDGMEIGDHTVPLLEFRLNRDTLQTSQDTSPQSGEGDGLRQRNVAQNTDKDDVATVTSAVQDLKVSSKSNTKDPIKWYGVLVPQALRDSQNRFRSVTDIACELATLKHQLEQLRLKFRVMLQQKENVINSV